MSSVFQSFMMAGFEGADPILDPLNPRRIDMVTVTQHDRQITGDYARLKNLGIRTLRESARWRLIDRGGAYDFSSLEPAVKAAHQYGLQVIWTLCHYGWPDDLTDIFSPDFVTRFAKYCEATARFIQSQNKSIPFYTPINEISFLTWGAGHKGIFYPFLKGQELEVKRQLVRAAITGIDAIRSVDPRARIVHVEPLIHVSAAKDSPQFRETAAREHEAQYEAWDMLAGKRDPVLGGHARYLDILGLNLYSKNQWVISSREGKTEETVGRKKSAPIELVARKEATEHMSDEQSLPYFNQEILWHKKPRSPFWVPFHRRIAEVHTRYGLPMILAETSHVGIGRADWLKEIVHEVELLRKMPDIGKDFHGICLYPIIDRPCWFDHNHWHNSGLWDYRHEADGTLTRVIEPGYAAVVRDALRRFGDLPPVQQKTSLSEMDIVTA